MVHELQNALVEMRVGLPKGWGLSQNVGGGKRLETGVLETGPSKDNARVGKRRRGLGEGAVYSGGF